LADTVFGPEDFAAQTNVSRETLDRLIVYADMLVDWNSRHNLVSERSLEDLWRRHFWDSAQLAPLIPESSHTLVDLGSGPGFPGLVLAVMRPDISVTLIEATTKKCDFLKAVVGDLGLPTKIRNTRSETCPPQAFDVITSRACAPLPRLLGYAQRFTDPGSVCLFLKGQNVGAELTGAHISWKMNVRQISSLTDPSAMILEIMDLSPEGGVLEDDITPPQTPHPGSRQSKRRRR
jgi:16S rRNA (guanine527-N7)-methyltransferase